ncbi:DUF1194 domain-containing protein [Roseomonas sp. AR75]|uniref:DUF1194 domain-containing protein n=1 Tax=Roseomonas sp. AR75 TaxID=2562311 RepID=UPI0010BF7A10|nr:DUF1194 domain-containing protein [Roseomonas sp. AR75]
MRRRTLLTAGCFLLATPMLARAQGAEGEVDLLLVLAADVSQSMRPDELRLQRQGYAAALRNADVHTAVGSGFCGAIGVLYIEWSGLNDQQVLVPWTRLASEADADDIARVIETEPRRGGGWTSISGAIAAAREQMAKAPFQAMRRVIDISGDGENNQGASPEEERDAAIAEGITINGLPIVQEGDRLAAAGRPGETQLEEHYRRLVIGGAGAFLVPTRGFEGFHRAIRRKLILEIAATPQARALAALA